MKRSIRWILAAASLVLLNAALVTWAAQTRGPEERIRDALIRIDRAGTALGEVQSLDRLATAFKVKPRIVMDLRDQKLNYGQVTLVLALSEAGRTSTDAILGLWATDRLNWGQIAARLKIDLPRLLHRLEDVRRDLGRQGS